MVETTLYKDALTNSMTYLGQQPDTVFIGQQVLWHGNPMSTTIGEVPKDKFSGTYEQVEQFSKEIDMLELPAKGCDGNSCMTAIALRDQVAQLEQQIYEHESVLFTLTSQLGINPFDDGLADSCCPRIIPNQDDEDPIV